MPVQSIYEGVSLVFIQVYFETMVNIGPFETLGIFKTGCISR